MADTVPENPSALSDQEMKALVAKHRAEIDLFKLLDGPEEEKAFRQIGIDPAAMKEHYKAFQQQADELKKQDAIADKRTVATGWVSFVAGFGSMFALRNKFAPGNKLLQWFAIPLSALGAGLAGTYIGSRVFAGKIREESKQMDIAARDAFERELAIALENRDREGTTAPSRNMAADIPAEKEETLPVLPTQLTLRIDPKDQERFRQAMDENLKHHGIEGFAMAASQAPGEYTIQWNAPPRVLQMKTLQRVMRAVEKEGGEILTDVKSFRYHRGPMGQMMDTDIAL